MCVCYLLYFVLLEEMASYDLNKPQDRQQYQNMKVLWGLYQSSQIISSQLNGRADDVASILTALIPLFVILCLCFLLKELDKWFVEHFNVTIFVDVNIKREMLRFKLVEERRIPVENAELREILITQNQADLEGDLKSSHNGEQHKAPGSEDQRSSGTLEMQDNKNGKSKADSSDSKMLEEEDNELLLGEEAELPEAVLESLLQADAETVAQYRGDQKCEASVTNQHVVEMIKDLLAMEHQLESSESQAKADGDRLSEESDRKES